MCALDCGGWAPPALLSSTQGVAHSAVLIVLIRRRWIELAAPEPAAASAHAAVPEKKKGASKEKGAKGSKTSKKGHC